MSGPAGTVTGGALQGVLAAVDAASYLDSFIDLCLHGLLSQPHAGSK